MSEPIEILAELVIASANDVLRGYQTYEEHEQYLLEMQKEYEAKGIKLPLDLSKEPERITDENHKHKPASGPQITAPDGNEKKISDSGQGVFAWTD